MTRLATRTLAAGGLCSAVVAVPARKPGYYRVAARVDDGRGLVLAEEWTGVVVVPRPRNYGRDDPKSFFGIQQTSDGARTERLGVKWVRAGRDWQWGELTRGVYLPIDLRPIRANHQTIMYTMSAYPPAWAKDAAGSEPFFEGPGAAERVGWWAGYVEHMARTYAP